MTLEGQTAIITGASSGIGEAVARNLNEAGMNLVVTARRGEVLEKLAADLDHVVSLPGDILEKDLPERLLQAARDSFGSCEVLFNNAGILELGGIDDIDIDRLCRMVRVNVESTFRMAYHAVRYFKKSGRGHLINTSSILGTKVRPTTGAYAGTKYAIEALTEALRLELAGSDIRVSCIEPGLVMTELHDHMTEHPSSILNIQHALQPADVARCVRFMLEQPDRVHICKMMMLPLDSGV